MSRRSVISCLGTLPAIAFAAWVGFVLTAYGPVVCFLIGMAIGYAYVASGVYRGVCRWMARLSS